MAQDPVAALVRSLARELPRAASAAKIGKLKRSNFWNSVTLLGLQFQSVFKKLQKDKKEMEEREEGKENFRKKAFTHGVPYPSHTVDRRCCYFEPLPDTNLPFIFSFF